MPLPEKLIHLKPDREKSLLRKHPWVFSGAVQSVSGNPSPGETVGVVSSKGRFLAKAAWSPKSQIRAKIWTFSEGQEINEDFFRERIRGSIGFRKAAGIPEKSDAYRLVHSESDGLPGLIADRYGDLIVVQLLSTGAEYWKDEITRILLDETGAKGIFERSDADIRKLEGLEPRTGWLAGTGSFPETGPLAITENGVRFYVDFATGHKTGFYLDQRDNRDLAGILCEGKDVLNCFCYTGGFSLYAAKNRAASVLSLDSSRDVLDLAEKNASLNELQSAGLEWMQADVFDALRKFNEDGRSWDVIILDPPKFAATTSQVQRAARGYKDINRLAFQLLRPGGALVTFSCSGGIDAALFRKVVGSAALDAGADARVVRYLSQGADHPESVHFPEGAYLKGLICIKN